VLFSVNPGLFFEQFTWTRALLSLQVLNRIFESADEEINQLSFCNLTYVIKVKPSPAAEPGRPRLLVAFSGSRYVLVCCSLTKYIIVQTEGRHGQEWLNDAAKWLNKLGQKLIDKKYWEMSTEPLYTIASIVILPTCSRIISYSSFTWAVYTLF